MGIAKRRITEMDERGYGSTGWSLCLGHIRDEHLHQVLASEVTENACTFCRRTDTDISAPFAVVGEAFMQSFMPGVLFLYDKAIEVLTYDSASGGYIGPQLDTDEVVWTVADELFDDDFADDICEAIVQCIGFDTLWTDFGSNGGTDDLEYSWDRFAATAKHKQRFVFTTDDRAHPEVGDVVRFLRRLADYTRDDLDLVSELQVGTILFRGRLASNPREIEHTANALGPAPEDSAGAGRFSPAGIPMFYAARDPQVAIAEIASHGPEQYAVVGAFETLRPLRVLDLTRRLAMPSLFDESKHGHYRMLSFLRSFTKHVTEAIIPDGRQHVDYVPTQIIAEYLRYVGEKPLDGIIVPSTQNPIFGRSGPRLNLTYQQNTDQVKENHAYFLDRADFITMSDSAGATPARSGPAFSQFEAARGPAMRLDPSKVSTYEVIRKYKGRLIS